MKKLSFQYGMKFSIENGFFHSGPLSSRRKTGLGIEIFKPRMKFSIENENFVRGNGVFFLGGGGAGMIFFDPRALWVFRG